MLLKTITILIRKVTGANLPPVPPPPPPPPAAPTIWTVLTNYGQVILTWSTVVGTNITYNIKRSPSSGGPYTTIFNTSSTSYTDTNVSAERLIIMLFRRSAPEAKVQTRLKSAPECPCRRCLTPTLGMLTFLLRPPLSLHLGLFIQFRPLF